MRFVPGRILVGFYNHISSEHAAEVIAALGVSTSEEITGDDGGLGVHILTLPAQANEAAFVNAFRNRPEVEFAELDQLVLAELIPNDLFYQNQEWHLPQISAPSAWDFTTGDPSIIIAILDTGVETTHPDLVDNLVSGRNIYSGNDDVSDIGSHGTGVAGTAAASSNNTIGVASVAWNCKIMPIRVTDAGALASYSNIASGLIWAADHGARVANISFIVSESSTVTSAAQYFMSKNGGGVVVASAGNQGIFSSASDNPYILTVTATNAIDQLYAWSNRGNNLDLCAPGEVYTTTTNSGYTAAAGTSFSAPIVAGVAALVLSVNPALTGEQVQQILKDSADDLGISGWDSNYGYGRVNAYRAVTLAGGVVSPDTTPPTVAFTSPANGATVSGTVPLTVSAADDVGVTQVVFKLDGVTLNTDSSAPFSFSWDSTTATNATHTLTATASDAAGNTATATISVIVNNVADGGSPPTVSITSPANLATVSGNVSVTVSVSGDVVAVELYVDGVLKATSKRAPFTTKWNTRGVASGNHTLQCKAYTATKVVGSSAIITVTK